MEETATIRILDAAANRASEGLRVVEDYVRFALDDKNLTKLVKAIRHGLASCLSDLPMSSRLKARDTQADVGTTVSTPTELSRTDSWDVCVASLERTKQSLRSLEEYGKVINAEFAASVEALRYQLYSLERCLGIVRESCLRLSNVQLCVLIDAQECLDSFRELVNQLLDAGVGIIQLRDKTLPDAELADRARELCRLVRLRDTANPSPNPSLQGRGTIVIINDRPDVAALTHADGVHLGQDDLSVKDARTIVGPRKLIGVSTHSIEQAREAVLDGADYLGAGPTFPSSTKLFDEFPGLGYLKQVAAEISLPTFAIGGVNGENLQQVLATGITRVAVSGAISNSSEPGTAAAQLLEMLPKNESEPPAPTDG